MASPQTFTELLNATVEEHPGREAVVGGDTRYTFSELQDRVDEFARGLASIGVKKGDHVGVLLSNRPEWFVANLAIQRLGATMVGLNTWHQQEELAYTLRTAEVSTLIAMGSFENNDYVDMLENIAPAIADGGRGYPNAESLPHLRNVVLLGTDRDWAYTWEEVANEQTVSAAVVERMSETVRPDTAAYILFSSGTTGQPKPIELTHDAIVTNARGIGARLGITAKDRFWVPVPLFFSLAACHEAIVALYYDATNVLQERFEPNEALRLLSEEECTVLYAMGNMLRDLEAQSDNLAETLSSARILQTVAPEAIRRRYEDKYGVDLSITGYGLTETSAVCAMTSHKADKETRMTTEGRPLPYNDIRIKDFDSGEEVPPGEEGEVCVRSRSMFRRYYNKPEQTREAIDDEGYLHTGDVGRLDEAGRLHFIDRVKDIIKVGGISVSPAEVESTLSQHPSVEESVVFGIPDEEDDDEVVVAAIVGEDGFEDVEELRSFCRDRLASYKVPKHIHFYDDELPRTGSGKVKKTELRDIAIEERS
jgi:fatty-acyl-CoA synthase